MQKWNILTDGAQKVDEKNGVICLVIMFNPRVIVIFECQKWLIVFSTDDSKAQFGQNISVYLEDLIYLFQKILWIIGFWATISKMSTFENTRFLYFLLTQHFFFIIPTIDISRRLTPKPINIISWKNIMRYFRCI